MSDKIDQRIVEMSFENEKFEKGISQSKNSLKEFSDVLKNTGMSDNFSGLEKSVTSLSSSFSMMEQIGIGALRKIGESAVTAGAQMVKSLSIDQVLGGFNEYELKINTIRAIMNSTGQSADVVREKLKSLDDYADKTIFSTKDMFDNLSTFTNAGISLDRATTAMIGIANATAYAGQGATSAMYAYRNFSDAISNGYMSLMDWRSISRVAKIGTQEMRQEFLKTAVELGTLTQAQIDSGAVTTNFEDTLKDQWMTADVVTETLRKYGDATTEVGAKAWAAAQEVRTFSGMMESLKASVGTQFASMSEIIFGDLNEAKRNFTSLYNILTVVFTDGLKNTNAMLSELKELGGISNIFEGIKNIAVSLLTILKPISQAFDQIFPPKTVSTLLKITESFKKFTASLLINKETADKIQRTFAGLFAVIDIGWQAFKFLSSAILEVVKIFLPLGNTFLGASANLGDLLVNIDRAVKSSKVFQYALLAIKVGVALLRIGLGSLIDIVKSFISGLWNAEDPLQYLKDIGSKVFSGLVEGVKMAVNWLSGKFTNVLKVLGNLFDVLATKFNAGNWSRVFNVLKEVVTFIGGKAVDGFQSFGDVIKNLDFHKIATFVAGGVLLIFVKQLSDLTKSMTGFTNAATGLVTGFTKKFLTSKSTSLIRDMALALGVLSASIWVLSTIPADDLKKSLIGLAEAVTIFVVAYGLIQGINVAATKLTSDKKMVSSAFGLVGLSAALLVMASAIKTISKIDDKQVWNATTVLGVMLGFITAYQLLGALISKIPGQTKVTASLFGMSASILAIVGALVLLKNFSSQDIQVSLGKMTGILLVLTAVQTLFGFAARLGGGKKVSVNILTMAAGIAAMVAVMKLLSIIDPQTITGGIGNLALITLILSGMEVMMGLAGRISGGKKLKTTMLQTQVGMLSMVALIAILSLMKQENIDRGIANLAKMAGIVTGIELLTAVSSRISGGAKVQKILGAVTVTMLSFTGVIALLGAFDPTVIDQGIVTLTKMVGLIGAIELMTAISSKISGDAKMFSSLIGVSVAIIALTSSLILLSMIDQDSLRGAATSLLIASALIGAIALLGKPLAALGPSIGPALLGVVTAIVAMGAIVLAVVGLAELLNLIIKNGDALTRGLDLLVEVGAGIGRFVGAIAGGIAGGVIEGIGQGVAGFVRAFDGVNFKSLDGIGQVATAILTITGAAILDGIANFITGKSSMEAFGEQLSALVTAIKVISPDDATATSATLVAMRPMAENLKLFAEVAKDIPNSGGFIGDFMGENDIDTFGIMLAKFVAAFINVSVDQATHMTDVLGAMKPMAANLKLFASVAQKIPNSGGFIGEFMGENDIDTFGTMLARFVRSFSTVTVDQAEHSSEVLSSMQGMAANLKLFANAAQEIPNAGGFLGDFLGTVDLPTFSGQIQGLIGTFGSVDQNQLKIAASSLQLMGSKMIPALTKFSELEAGLKTSGGLAQFFSGNTTLSEFGTDFRKFVDQISAIDTSVVGPAMDALSRVAVSFETIGSTVIDNAKKSFDNNKEPFQKSISTIFDAPIKDLTSKKETLLTTVSSIFTSAVETGNAYAKEFKNVGINLINGLKSGIIAQQSSAIKAIKDTMSQLVSSAKAIVDAHSPSKVFETIGGWCTKGLANGLAKETGSAVSAGVNMAKATENGVRDTLGVHSLSDLFSNIGEYIPKSIGEGIQNGKDSLLDKAKSLGIDTGDLTLEGVASAISGGDGTVTSGIKSLLELLTGKTTESAEETGTSLGSSLTGAFNNALSGLGGAETKVKTELEKLKDLIDEREFYGTITLEQELEMYQNLRSSYAEGSEERKQIDREIYTRLKTIYEAQLSYIDGVKKAETEAAQKIKDLKEKYDQDVLDTNADVNEKSKKEETSYYENLNSILENAEKERQKLREDYAKNQKSINDKLLSDIESQNEAYENAVKSRAQSIYNSYNLFDAVGSDQDYSGTDLLDNLQSQVNALTEWEQSLRDLANRGVGDGLIEELQSMGPSSKAQINALLTLTDDQLSEYVNLFEQKYALANDKATAELTDLKNTTQQNIQDLKSQAAADLYDLETEFNDAMTTIDTNMASDMSKLRTTHAEAMNKINSDLETKLTELETTWKTESTKVQTDQEEALKTLKNSYSTTMKEISGLTEEELLKLVADNKTNLAQLKADTEAKLAEVEKTYEKSATDTVSSFGSTFESIIPTATATLDTLKTTVKTTLDESVTDFEEAGLNAATGFANGITNGVYKAVSAAQLLAQEAVSAAQKILDEHSPSAVFEGIGKFVSMGFANGIIAYANKAQEASETMANGPIALVSQALSDMSDSDDLSPEITPVLNLSNIKTQLSSLFSSPVLFGSASSQLAAEAIQNGSEKSASATVLASIAAKLQQLAQKNSASDGQSSQGTVLSPTFIFQVGGNVDKGTAKSIVEQVTDEFETYMALQGV